jgi:hypothetical protein
VTDARVVGAEAVDRAVDDALRRIREAQSLGDAGAETLKDDVRTGAEREPEFRLGLQVAYDRLLAGVEGGVPGGRDRPEWIALRPLEANHARAEPQQLAARERPREIPRQIDDEQACERLHGAGS